MNKTATSICAACAALWAVVFMLFGCASGTNISVNTPDGTNINGSITYPIRTNVDLTVTGGANAVTGDWHTGISITFKETPPDHVVKELLLAGATKMKGGDVWIIENADPQSARVQKAVGAALGVPGTVVKGQAK